MLCSYYSGVYKLHGGRNEIRLSELNADTTKLFNGPGGSDKVEWDAWQSMDACEVIPFDKSAEIRRAGDALIIPTRWVRMNKADSDKDFIAKSRLVVQGFKDRALGQYRRDAPTASSLAEMIVLITAVANDWELACGDVKNAYFAGKDLTRDVYLE